jgi:hypothetical protein
VERKIETLFELTACGKSDGIIGKYRSYIPDKTFFEYKFIQPPRSTFSPINFLFPSRIQHYDTILKPCLQFIKPQNEDGIDAHDLKLFKKLLTQLKVAEVIRGNKSFRMTVSGLLKPQSTDDVNGN